MIRHTRFGIRGGHTRHQLGSCGVAWHYGAPPGLADTQRFLAEYERNTIFLADSPVANDAILIQNWSDVATEGHLIARHSWEERTHTGPSQQCS